MAFVLKTILIVFVLTCAQAQYPQQLYPTATCPLLCVGYCNSTSTCASCYTSFFANSPTQSSSQTCTCPQSTYLAPNFLCQPCPVYCLTCTNYTYCTSCVPGFMLQNNYSCILNTTNLNGWVTKNVTYDITGPDYIGVSNLIVLLNGSTAINITNNPQNLGTVSSNCSKLSSQVWLGGHTIFNFRTKIIKTVFNLPPHQWLNVMFQAILIDYWYNNTLVL